MILVVLGAVLFCGVLGLAEGFRRQMVETAHALGKERAENARLREEILGLRMGEERERVLICENMRLRAQVRQMSER